MSIYLHPRSVGGSYAICVCPRCNMKMYYGDLVKDPNNGNRYCKECVDLYDPYRLPARRAEDIGLKYPRPDVELEV